MRVNVDLLCTSPGRGMPSKALDAHLAAQGFTPAGVQEAKARLMAPLVRCLTLPASAGIAALATVDGPVMRWEQQGARRA